MTDQTSIKTKDLVHLARLAMAGQKRDIEMYVRRLVAKYRGAFPELTQELSMLLRDAGSGASLLRGGAVDNIPVDLDSRLQLARVEYPAVVESEPVWGDALEPKLLQILTERRMEDQLYEAGLAPTKTALFTGSPGVGKTLAARWLARALDRPLVVLDLSAVMSSFLGRTGNNLRNVLDYARGVRCVLLLDEFDAIAKRRDDAVEVGELKRLVTVLLQEIDDWPATGLLIAATNHKELLDPAVWRRFDAIVEFPMPPQDDIQRFIHSLLGEEQSGQPLAAVVAKVLDGLSFAEIRREILRAKRIAVIDGLPIIEPLKQLVHARAHLAERANRAALALALLDLGLSQREAQEWTGVSRDTMRKALHN